MAGIYGQPQVTYGQAGSTYESWSVAGSHGGGRFSGGGFATKHGRIDWFYVITGSGTLEGSGLLDLSADLVPVGASSTLSLDLGANGELHGAGRARDLDYRLTGSPDAYETSATLDLSTGVTLLNISDPPELWDLLGLPDLEGIPDA